MTLADTSDGLRAESPAPSRRAPQHQETAEQAVLGAAMQSEAALDDVAGILKGPEDFYDHRHGLIYRALLGLRESGVKVDPLNLMAAMDPSLLGKIGGGNYLHTCMAQVPTVANGPYYARQVRALAMLRDLAQHGARSARLAAESPVTEAGRALELARESLDGISLAGGTSTLRDWDDVMTETVTELDRITEQAGRSELPGISMGWPDVDRLLNNLQQGQVITVAGRPGSGKSVVGLNTAQHVAVRLDKWALLFSLEMSSLECGMRMLAAGAGVPLNAMRSGQLTDADWTRVARYLGTAESAKVQIDDSPNQSLAHIHTQIRQHLVAHRELGVVVVDYLQLMEPPDGRAPRQEQVAALMRGLKLMAKKYRVPFIVICQLNRGPEQRASRLPQLGDLRESGAIENDSDVVILLHRDDYYDKESPRAGEIDFIVAKHRQGPTDTITLAAQLHLARLVSMAIDGFE